MQTTTPNAAIIDKINTVATKAYFKSVHIVFSPLF